MHGEKVAITFHPHSCSFAPHSRSVSREDLVSILKENFSARRVAQTTTTMILAERLTWKTVDIAETGGDFVAARPWFNEFDESRPSEGEKWKLVMEGVERSDTGMRLSNKKK